MEIYLLNCESGDDFSSYTSTHTLNAYYLREEAEEALVLLQAEESKVEHLESYFGVSDELNKCISYELCQLTGTCWSRWFIWYGMWNIYTIEKIELI